MTNFTVELDSLIYSWMKRGEDPDSMIRAMKVAIQNLDDSDITITSADLKAT